MNEDLSTYCVVTDVGERQWEAENADHAVEQSIDAFPDESILGVHLLATYQVTLARYVVEYATHEVEVPATIDVSDWTLSDWKRVVPVEDPYVDIEHGEADEPDPYLSEVRELRSSSADDSALPPIR